MKQKAVLSILITVLLAVPAVFLSGCATGQVVPPFTPQPIKPEPYTPEPVWNDRTDPNLLALQQIKQKTGQMLPPGGATAATTGGTTTGGTTGGVTPQPTPAPPAPTPLTPAIWTLSGIVKDRITGTNIAGATVQLLNNVGSVIDSVTTDSNGFYQFRDKPNVPWPSFGLNQVIASKTGYTQIPLSSNFFFFDGNSLPLRTLELSLSTPTQQKEAGEFVAPPTGNVQSLWFYVDSPQKVYNGALFNSTSVWPFTYQLGTGVGAVKYEFTLFSPENLTKYEVDSLKLTFVETWRFDGVTTFLWVSGGNVTAGYYQPGGALVTPANWNNVASSTTLVIPPSDAYNSANGKVAVYVSNVAGQQLLLTYVKLTYDYHLK
ncbi:MAG: carboxypeptidase-like regulatory domain-containing protein [Actinomycetota bacterium]